MGSTKPPLSIRENLPAPGARLTSTALATAVVAAPVVELNASMDTRRHLDPSATEVKYNPRYEAQSNVQCGVNQSLLLVIHLIYVRLLFLNRHMCLILSMSRDTHPVKPSFFCSQKV